MTFKTALQSAKPTPKVAAQTTVGVITGLITWLLVTTYWKSGLPIQVAVALPGIVTWAMGFTAGWLKKENITIPPLVVGVVDRASPAITMYDSTNPADIPSDAALVAAYVDGYGGYSTAVTRFGAAKVISISVGNNDADVADVESGAMTPADLPGWITRQQARGIARPVVYCNQSTWPSVKSAVGGANVSYWIANPGGSGTITGADAVQNVWDSSWDSSVVQPTFPFYPGVAPPTPPASAWPLVLGDTGANVTTVQTDLNKWATPIKLKTKLVVDGNFGALTEAAVKLALTYFDYSAANVALGQVPESLATHLAGAVPAPPPPPAPKYYGAPRSATAKAIVPATANYTLEWAAPAAVAGVPAPTEYELFVYNGEANEAHIVAGYPLTVVGTSHELANLTAGDHYIVHIVAAGDSVFIGPDVFATVDVSPPFSVTNGILAFMLAQVGKPYSEEVPERFGPDVFDCSGLVWAAANSVGDSLPGGPTNDAAALVPYEMQWFAGQAGVQLITSAADIQEGDLIAFTGGDPAPFEVTLQGHVYPAGEFGHIGMATSSTEYVSAYDTADGVCVKPIAGDVFNAALRLTPSLL